MTQLAIIGAGGHAKVVAEASGSNDFIFLVEAAHAGPEKLLGADVYTIEALTSDTFPSSFIAAVGDITVRRRLFDLMRSHGASPISIIATTATVSKSSQIEPGCFLGEGAIINADADIGANTIINTGAIVEHDVLIGDHANISPRATICGGAEIGMQTLIGAGALILPGIKVGNECVVGAGGVVTRDVANGERVGGVPACKI